MAENSPRIEREARPGDRPYVPQPDSSRPEGQRDRWLLEAAEFLVQGRPLPELLEKLAPRVLSLTGSDFLKFSLFDPSQNCMIVYYWKDRLEIPQADAFAIDECISGLVWSEQAPEIIPDLEQEKRFPRYIQQLRKLGVRSYAMLPLTVLAHRFGALGLGRNVPGALDPKDLEFFTRFAYVVALALENQRLSRASQEERERLQGLVTIGQELSSSLELDRAMPLVLAKLRKITGYDFAVLALLEADRKFLQLYSVDNDPGLESVVWEGRRELLSEATSARAIATRSITFWDAEQMDKLGTPLMKELREAGIQSLCNFALHSADQVFGALSLGGRRRNAIHREDAGYLQQAANQITAAVRNANAYREVAQLKDRLASEKRYLESEIRSEMRWDEIVGKSPALKRVLDYASIVATTDSTVLITGETGTGKERVARSIHVMSRRRERSFIKLNCAAIPTGLLESELFGHEKGAFTGAVSQKIGRLELADKGTLFLDEIGEIPLELQPKLLRVLQDQEFERLGGNRTIRVDARLISATNRDLAQAVETKQFRSDLFYRLHVFPLHLPALRDRREDIPMLVRHFVEKSSARLGRRIETVPEEAMEAMLHWNWPGNIRELENFIERSVILSDGPVLRAPLSELQQEIGRQRSTSEGTLEDRERDHIIEVLRHTRGLLSGPRGAAARLGLKRTTLQYKLQKLGIERTEFQE